MASSRPPRPTTTTTPFSSTHGGAAILLRRLQEHSPNSTQLIGLLILIISGGILLLFTGLTITAIVVGLIFLAPIIVLSSPLWVPVAVVLFASTAVVLSVCGFGVTALATLSWLYRYFRGLHPPGSDRFDYARTRIATTAREVKDYAREYGGYLHSKVKDAAPGA